MAGEGLVTIQLPATIAGILRDVCEEWIADHARSPAMKKMTGLVLSVMLEEIEKQITKAEEPAPSADSAVKCDVCGKTFKTAKGLATHAGRMNH